MIDTQIFLKCITKLSNHYDRKLLPSVLPIWKEYCDSCLTTEQFQQAIKITILESRFFPTAKEIVEAVKGNPEVQALLEWETCLKAAERADTSVTDSLTPQGKFALRAIGGVSELGRTNEDDLRWVLKEFVSAWIAWTPDASRALPAAGQEPVLSQGVGCEQTYQIQALSQKLSFNGNGRRKS